MHFPAAGNVDRLTGHVAGPLRGQEAGHIDHVVDASQSAEWHFGSELLDDLVDRQIHVLDIVSRHVAPHAGRFGNAGTDTVDADVVSGQFEGQRLGQSDDRRFGRRVGTHQGRAGLARLAGEIDNAATAGLLHQRHDFLDEQKRPFAVDGKDKVPCLFGDVFHGTARPRNACHVDQHVDLATEGLLCCRHDLAGPDRAR